MDAKWIPGIKWILESNKKLFPFFVLIFLMFVLLKSLNLAYFRPYPNLFNLNYKIIFVLASGMLLAIDKYLIKKHEKSPAAQ